MRRTIIALLLATACSTPQNSETKEDSVAVLSEDTLQVETQVGENGTEGADTTRIKDIKSAFTEPQNDTKIAFVYREDGLMVYRSLDDVNDPAKALDTLAYGEMIELVDPLVNSQPSDKIVFEGFKGRYIETTTADGTPGYVFSGYLTNFPIPPESVQIVDYFLKFFQLLESPRKITSKSKIEGTPEWFKTQLKFESGIIVDDDGYYEGSSTYATLPKSCTLQEGFLLLKTFKDMEAFKGAFPTYPTSKMTRKIDDTHSITVESDREGIYKISYSDESGCSDDTSVIKDNGRITIGRGGGC